MAQARTPSVKRAARPARAAAADEPASQVLRRFRVVFNAVKTHFRQVEKKAGIGGAQLWALALVRDHPGIGVSDLARRMDIHQSTASNLIRSLGELGLLTAEKTATDRRAVHLRVLPAGSKVLRRAPGPFTGVLPDALASLDRATLRRLDCDLGRLIDLLGTGERGAHTLLQQSMER
jgi:MarR family transcriptional regulator, organic hydroperoxide resistance regulator